MVPNFYLTARTGPNDGPVQAKSGKFACMDPVDGPLRAVEYAKDTGNTHEQQLTSVFGVSKS